MPHPFSITLLTCGEQLRLATRDEVGEDNWDLVTKLASARLVVTNKTEKTKEQEKTEQETVEIIHEALIREWGTLRDWMDANRDFRTWQERLKVKMEEWEKSNQDNGALLRGVPLGEAEVWLQKRKDELSKSEQDFIVKSVDFRETDLKNKKLRQRYIFSVLSLGLLTVSIFAVGTG